mmetsp:Transcript_1514/g.3346  ORF Transcript_1514/g.3346 Transcript_1514/m.3346 type:complete len:251 (+) Transcript_1514:161-913(+)
MTRSFVLLLSATILMALRTTNASYQNVYGNALASCSSDGMARTGFMRDGHCTEVNDDAGSHHICINVSSTSGGNFCTVTGQPNWCSYTMGCHSDYHTTTCPVENWCVCQWAFASYISRAGGCEYIQDVICEATNAEAMRAYEENRGSSQAINDAYECLKQRCPGATALKEGGAQHEHGASAGEEGVAEVEEGGVDVPNALNRPVLAAAAGACALVGVAGGYFIGRRARGSSGVKALASRGDDTSGRKEML